MRDRFFSCEHLQHSAHCSKQHRKSATYIVNQTCKKIIIVMKKKTNTLGHRNWNFCFGQKNSVCKNEVWKTFSEIFVVCYVGCLQHEILSLSRGHVFPQILSSKTVSFMPSDFKCCKTHDAMIWFKMFQVYHNISGTWIGFEV